MRVVDRLYEDEKSDKYGVAPTKRREQVRRAQRYVLIDGSPYPTLGRIWKLTTLQDAPSTYRGIRQDSRRRSDPPKEIGSHGSAQKRRSSN